MDIFSEEMIRIIASNVGFSDREMLFCAVAMIKMMEMNGSSDVPISSEMMLCESNDGERVIKIEVVMDDDNKFMFIIDWDIRQLLLEIEGGYMTISFDDMMKLCDDIENNSIHGRASGSRNFLPTFSMN